MICWGSASDIAALDRTKDKNHYNINVDEPTGTFELSILGSADGGDTYEELHNSGTVSVLNGEVYFVGPVFTLVQLKIEDKSGSANTMGVAITPFSVTGVGSLNDLIDVNIPSPVADDSILIYDLATKKWEDATTLPATATAITIADAGDYYTGTEVEAALQEIGDGTTTKVNHPLRSEWLQNGIVDRDDSTLAFVDGTRVFTINRTGASFDYFVQGVKYTVATDDVAGVNTVTLTDGGGLYEGLWAIYYDGSVLTAVKNPSHSDYEDVICTKCIVALVYYDDDNNIGILYEERHGFQMAPWTHRYLHETVGMAYAEGLGLGDFVISDGADNEDAQFSIASGECYDEDLDIDLNAINKTTGNIIYYRDSSDWRWTTQTGFKCMTFDGTSSTRLAYDNAGTLTEVTDNDFVLLHVFATNAYDGNCISIIGQAEYANRNAARDGAETEIANLILGTLPSKEMKPIASIIFQTKDSYANDVNAKIVQTSTGEDYVDWRTSQLSAGVAAADHGSLGGLSDDDHPQYLLADGTRALAGAWDMNNQVLTNVNIDTGDIANAVTNAEWDAAYGHVSASGASHTYIDQDVTDGSSPDFDASNFTYPIRTETANYNILLTDYTVLSNNGSGTINFNLPTAASASGKIYNFKHLQGGISASQVVGNGGETIDGATPHVLSGQYSSVTIQSDGSNWHILAEV